MEMGFGLLGSGLAQAPSQLDLWKLIVAEQPTRRSLIPHGVHFSHGIENCGPSDAKLSSISPAPITSSSQTGALHGGGAGIEDGWSLPKAGGEIQGQLT